MLSIQEYKSFIESLPTEKTSSMLCSVYEKFLIVDRTVFHNARFRFAIVQSLDQNFFQLEEPDQDYLASVILPFLLKEVFNTWGTRNLGFDAIALGYPDLYCQEILLHILKLYLVEKSTVNEEEMNSDAETQSDSGISIYSKSTEETMMIEETIQNSESITTDESSDDDGYTTSDFDNYYEY